jgi:hypothetical protein
MPMGPDYRKVPYDSKAGRRSLAVCLVMVLVGSAAFLSPISDMIDRNFAMFGYHANPAGFVPQVLIFLGIFNVIPAVMTLTQPSKR